MSEDIIRNFETKRMSYEQTRRALIDGLPCDDIPEGEGYVDGGVGLSRLSFVQSEILLQIVGEGDNSMALAGIVGDGPLALGNRVLKLLVLMISRDRFRCFRLFLSHVVFEGISSYKPMLLLLGMTVQYKRQDIFKLLMRSEYFSPDRLIEAIGTIDDFHDFSPDPMFFINMIREVAAVNEKIGSVQGHLYAQLLCRLLRVKRISDERRAHILRHFLDLGLTVSQEAIDNFKESHSHHDMSLMALYELSA